VVTIVLGQGALPDFPENGSRTPLLCAASGRQQGVVKILLGQEKVNPNKPDHNR